ncbi:hypothetical protein P3X46_031929 [Hevea brasiliensis]|uniref:PGG domain-containing protein n=1 Tax=Hevea brasiliensis TaxID=3981 RepID=A0ABQ9KNA4_HEVBR|nr:ankyrin repeat-containing protein NPR4 [Hevea brasiliensis]KAJ9141387.1 hypothetical protein P3X46_031929 [Hevea brasiliensis]KAJ9141388.1 hypothetical protein P3X46_031929 [Hevea brasiliensis]
MSNTSINCTRQGCPHPGDNLKVAAERGIFDLFEKHLDHLDSIVAPNGDTILHIYVSCHWEISTDFMKQVVVKCPRLFSQENCGGDTPLHVAARHGYTDVAKELIRLAEVSYDALETHSGEVATETLHDAVDTQHGKVATEMLHDVVDTHSVEATTVTFHDVDTQSGEVAIRILDNEADIQSGEVATETLHDALDTQIGEVATETLHDAVDTQSEEVAAGILHDAVDTQSEEVATETLHDAVDTQHGKVATEMLHDVVDTHSVEATTVTFHDVDTQSGEVAIRILDNEADIQSGEVATETLHDALDTQIGEVATETLHDAVDTQSEEVAAGMLHDAVDTQSEEVATERAMKAVRKLLRKVNGKKETALHVAARNEKSLGVVKTILSKEDPHYIYSANNRGETPLYLAVDNTCTNIVAELLNNPNSRSLDYGGPDGETVLHTAVRRWDTDVVCMLLEKQSSLIKKKGKFEWTPLHVAAHEGSRSTVVTLLDKDKSIANIATETLEMTALHVAAAKGNKHAMNEIISKCSDCCKFTSKDGKNVLHYAVYSKNEEVLKAILENSSLISLIIKKDNNGSTPVHLFKGLGLPLPTFVVDGDNDAFILWKKLYDRIPNNFIIKDGSFSILGDIFDVLECRPRGKENIIDVMKCAPTYKTKMAKEREEKIILQLKEAKDSHLVTAALVATVTFAAAFTLPGGYVSDEKDSGKGTPILSKNSAFKAFIISDTIAMVLSISSVFINFIMAMLGYGPKYYWLIKTAFRFILLAMGAMVVAFVTGTYAVLAPSLGLAIATCAIGLSFFLFLFYIFIRLYRIPRGGGGDDDDDDDGRILTLSWLSFGGWWLIDGWLLIDEMPPNPKPRVRPKGWYVRRGAP